MTMVTASAVASSRVVFIFQLPAMNLRRTMRFWILDFGFGGRRWNRDSFAEQLGQFSDLSHQLRVLFWQQCLWSVGFGSLGAVVNFDVHAVGADSDAGQSAGRNQIGPTGGMARIDNDRQV